MHSIINTSDSQQIFLTLILENIIFITIIYKNYKFTQTIGFLIELIYIFFFFGTGRWRIAAQSASLLTDFRYRLHAMDDDWLPLNSVIILLLTAVMYLCYFSAILNQAQHCVAAYIIASLCVPCIWKYTKLYTVDERV